MIVAGICWSGARGWRRRMSTGPPEERPTARPGTAAAAAPATSPLGPPCPGLHNLLGNLPLWPLPRLGVGAHDVDEAFLIGWVEEGGLALCVPVVGRGVGGDLGRQERHAHTMH